MRPSNRSAPRSAFLPPCSPDFNPIELAFAKLNAFLRAIRPRTFEHVCDLITAALGLLTSDECANHSCHCGERVATPYGRLGRVLFG